MGNSFPHLDRSLQEISGILLTYKAAHMQNSPLAQGASVSTPFLQMRHKNHCRMVGWEESLNSANLAQNVQLWKLQEWH